MKVLETPGTGSTWNQSRPPLAVDNEITLQIKGSQIKHNFMSRLNIGRLY